MMKKILCAVLAVVMMLGCAAFAENDLQAQLDAANAKIEELQALVDAYYPYYKAQIVATYGEDGVVWLEDVAAEYEALNSQYASYGFSLADLGMEEMAKKDLIDTAVINGVLKLKGAELGLDQLDEETVAALKADAEIAIDYYLDYYLSYYYPDAEEYTEEMLAEAEAYWASTGLDVNTYYDSLVQDKVADLIYDYVTADVAIDEADVQAAYETALAEDEAVFAEDAQSFIGAHTNGDAIAWNPEGYRTVKHVLIKFDDEQSARYNDLYTQLESLQAELEALNAPAEETEEAEEAAEPRSAEEINADITACAVEMEALYSTLLPTAQEVIDAFNNGTDFQTLIEQYNADPGMMSGSTAENGYAVCSEQVYWDPAFIDGAMSIAEVGQISEPVYGSYGIHIIYYLADIPAGPVALEEIRTAIEETALAAKVQTTYDAQVEAWVADSNVEYFYESFGL